MAYSLSDRFPPPTKCNHLLDPGAYEIDVKRKISSIKFPFLSNTPRNTHAGNKIWSDKIYYANQPPTIPNCTALQSKCPRFSYESFSKQDLENILCRCGIEDQCECPIKDEEEKVETICQAKVPKCLYKGYSPRSIFRGNSLPAPQKNQECPPFYDSRVNESTAIYRGCKWSRWTSQRTIKSLESRPGPADYTIEKRDLTYEELCAEKLRHHKRKTSKQLRYIEMIQEKNIAEERPGPATYNPELSKSINNKYSGPKSERFPKYKYIVSPGPADYILKRDFEIPEAPKQPCHVILPEPSCFGVKAQRFKPSKQEGPSPASYNVNYKLCRFVLCPTAPFESSTNRFKENVIISEDIEQDTAAAENKSENKEIKKLCSSSSWVFKSKTLRMKPLIKKPNEASPADLPQPHNKIERLSLLQHIAPFFSSEGRFNPWHDWMPVFGRVKTPGPAYYHVDSKKRTCITRGPICRTVRFPSSKLHTPGPNKYNVGGGVDTILSTHNHRLKCNIENQHQFIWDPHKKQKKLNPQEQEMLLLTESIRLLDENIFDKRDIESPSIKISPRRLKTNNSKLLRCFLYDQQMPHCF